MALRIILIIVISVLMSIMIPVDVYAQSQEYGIDEYCIVNDRATGGVFSEAFDYERSGLFQGALELYQSALVIYEGRRIDSIPVAAFAYCNIGRMLVRMGRYVEARAVFERAEPLFGTTRRLAYAYMGIGDTYAGQEQNISALEYYNLALGRVENWGGNTGRLIVFDILPRIGDTHMRIGQYEEAQEAYNHLMETVDDFIRTGGPEWMSKRPEVWALYGLARAQTGLGAFDQAELNLANALTISLDQNWDYDQEEGRIRHQMGVLDLRLQRTTEALQNLRQSLVISQEVFDWEYEARTLIVMGQLYTLLGLYDEASTQFSRVLENNDLRAIGRIHAEALMGQIEIDIEQGRIEDAINQLNMATNIYEDINNLAGVGLTNKLRADINCNVGRTDAAMLQYDAAIADLEQTGELLQLSEALVARGECHELVGDSMRALEDYQSAIEISRQIVVSASIDDFVAQLSSERILTHPYQRLSAIQAANGQEASALEIIEQQRTILLKTGLASSPINFRQNLDADLLNIEIDFRWRYNYAMRQLAALLQDSQATSTQIQEAQDNVRVARENYDQYLRQLQLEGGYIEREISFEAASIQEVQSTLDEDTTLLLYSLAPNNSYNPDAPKSIVFLVTQNRLTHIVLDITIDEIQDHVSAFTSVRQANSNALADIYDLIFAPLRNEINTSRLIISADGPLNYIPFAALYDDSNDTPRYLIDDYTISMIPSGTVLVLLSERERIDANSPGLVISQDTAPGLPQLPNADREAIEIGNILGVPAIQNATERQLRENVAGAGVLLISAHAELNKFAPLYSVIHLGASDVYDGRLEVREIYELDLTQGTDLVILSGCETGSGGNGEDFGLMNRAFFTAGAQQVVSSLWSVDDAATADLLISFMNMRSEYENTADALRAAMLMTRDQYPDPYFWASFVLTGQPVLRQSS